MERSKNMLVPDNLSGWEPDLLQKTTEEVKTGSTNDTGVAPTPDVPKQTTGSISPERYRHIVQQLNEIAVYGNIEY